MDNPESDMRKSLDARASDLHSRIIQSIANPEKIIGCSDQEIKKLEKACGLPLPFSYQVFLKHFGHGFARIANEVDFLYQDVFPLTKIAREILQDEGDPVLPENAFVFAMRYGEQFAFFEASKNLEDLPIFFYMENDENFTRIDESIFDFWEAEIKLKESVIARRRARNADKS